MNVWRASGVVIDRGGDLFMDFLSEQAKDGGIAKAEHDEADRFF